MPHLTATIESLSQDMDLKSGSMANFMMLRLPNGRLVRALIGDDAAQEIVSLSVGTNGTTIPAPAPVWAEEPGGDAVDVTTHIFGGAAQKLEAPPPDDEVDEPLPVPPPAPPPSPPPARPRRRPKSVSKDEMGYPVVQMEGGVDPREMTSSRDQDEDGVGQI